MNKRKLTVIAFLFIGVALLYSVFSPPLIPLSDKDRRNIELAIQEKTESRFLKITQFSYFRVEVDAKRKNDDQGGGEYFRLTRTLNGWKVTEHVLYIN